MSACVVTSPAGIRCLSACVSFLIARWPTSTWHSLQASVCVFSDRTMAYQQPSRIASDRAAAAVIHCMPKNLLQASVCVFSDRMMAHQHLESVVVRKQKHVGGMGNTFSCFLCHHSSTPCGIKAEVIMIDLM